jgi:hypothetical protein
MFAQKLIVFGQKVELVFAQKIEFYDLSKKLNLYLDGEFTLEELLFDQK